MSEDVRTGAKLSMAQVVCAAVATVVTIAGGGLWAAGIGSGGGGSTTTLAQEPSPGGPGATGAAGTRFVPVPGGATGFVPVPVEEGSPFYEQGVESRGEEGAGEAFEVGGVAITPAVFRLGFSFLAGFAVAYALRAFVKVTLIALGAGILLVAGLQYAGLVSVDWGAISSRWDGVSAWLGRNTESFLGFLTGQLPSAGSAMAGLVMGFRRVKM